MANGGCLDSYKKRKHKYDTMYQVMRDQEQQLDEQALQLAEQKSIIAQLQTELKAKDELIAKSRRELFIKQLTGLTNIKWQWLPGYSKQFAL